MTDRLLLGAMALLLAMTAVALAQEVGEVSVAQKNREFSASDLDIAAGSVLVFSNLDDFPHQISAKGPGVMVISGLQRTGEVLRIAAPRPGEIQIRCGIHPRMRLAVHVQ